MSARHFKPKNLFQKEVLCHMQGRFISYKEKEFLRKIFDALDDEKDGELTVEEYCDQFKLKFGLELPYKEMLKVISCIDFADGGDGQIQFTEFILAACSKKSLLSNENIIKEFRYLDMDKDNKLGLEDIRKFMLSLKNEDDEDERDIDKENAELEEMQKQIIKAYKPKQEMDMSDQPEDWNTGPWFIDYATFEAMLNEVNDSIKKPLC